MPNAPRMFPFFQGGNTHSRLTGWPLKNPSKEGFYVRVIGLEPTCLTASDPKSDTSANFATPAFLRRIRVRQGAKIRFFIDLLSCRPVKRRYNGAGVMAFPDPQASSFFVNS
jgi:hypothetical protein